jgi:uncharacterized membrane protein YesL
MRGRVFTMDENQERVFDVSPGEKYIDDRSRIRIFFQVLGRKFWKLISVNLIYLIFNIPAIIASVFIAAYILLQYMPAADAAAQGDPITLLMVGTFPIMMFMMAVPAISVGPAAAGLTYLLRCFSYEMPTFDWSDFKDKMKENLKQGLAVGLINLLLTVFLLLDFYLYSQIKTASSFIPIANGFLIIVFLLFLMMNLYLYPMMVTYNLNLKNLYRNALIFAFAKFLPNLAALIICFLLTAAPILIVNYTGSVLALTVIYLYYILLGFTLPGLVTNFMVNPIIDKYMNPSNKDKQNEEKKTEQ